jgi:hypothetical protein
LASFIAVGSDNNAAADHGQILVLEVRAHPLHSNRSQKGEIAADARRYALCDFYQLRSHE